MPSFYGEQGCEALYGSGDKEGQKCTNKAYYRQGIRLLCGVHSSPSTRSKLPKNPNAAQEKEDKYKKQNDVVEEARVANEALGKSGDVICTKLRMRRLPEDVDKHQGRKDGFGCANLSPKSLGPVDHQQKGLPPAKLLENYHQFNKVFDCEVDSKGEPSAKFYARRLSGYKDTVPHRYKFDRGSKSRTLYSVHEDRQGHLRHYNYVQSRYFYCHFYEKLVVKQEQLDELKDLRRKGTNLQIVGFDGYRVTDDLMKHYVDASRPFGHEMALYTMLTVEEPSDYPWNQYYNKHEGIYPTSLAPIESNLNKAENESIDSNSDDTSNSHSTDSE